MAPLAKPMAPQALALSRRDRGHVMVLARSSSLEGSTVSDKLHSEGPTAESWASSSRRDGASAAGQVQYSLAARR